MQPLIRLRSLGDQLNEKETLELLTKITQKHGPDMMFTCLFNHFLAKYNQLGQHDDALSSVIEFTSEILNAK